jgi:sarcosine oxidase subunit beta
VASKDRIARAEIVVIGAGIMGASIAFQLMKKGARDVLLIDARRPVGGMSARTFGQVRQHYSNALMVRLALRGFEVLRQWQSEIGYGDPGYVPLGYLLLVVKGQHEACKRNVALGASLGVETSFVGPEEIKAIEPLIAAEGLSGGAYEPNGGYIDVTRMILAWLCGGAALGLRTLYGEPVQALLTKGGRIAGVETAQGRIAADTVIDVSGPWARDLLDPIGVSVPIERRRLDMALLKDQPGRPHLSTCITDGNSNVVMRPDLGPYMMVVAYPGTMPLVDDPLMEAPPEEVAQHQARIKAAFRVRLPSAEDAVLVRSVSGVYDVTPDYHPILGWAPGIEGLYLTVGFSGHGLKLSPVIGEVVADTVLGREPAFDISALRPTRFQEGQPMFLAYGPSARA